MKSASILLGGLALAGCGSSAEAPGTSNNAASVDAAPAVDATTGNKLIGEAAPKAGNDSAPAASPPPVKLGEESYSALGQEPGWALKIAGGRIDYAGNYGEKKINVERPQPTPLANGRRYTTARLTVTLAYLRCNDAMSGFGFEHQVTVVADGETYQGCGGARKKEWDI